MEKIIRFKDIPQFTRDGNWQCDFSLEQLVDFVNEEEKEQKLQLNPFSTIAGFNKTYSAVFDLTDGTISGR